MSEKSYKVLVPRADIYGHADINNSERVLLLAAFDGQSLLEAAGSVRSYNRMIKSMREKNLIQEVNDEELASPTVEDPTLYDPTDQAADDEFQDLADDEPGLLVFSRDQLNEGRNERFKLFCSLYPGADHSDEALRSAWVALEKDNKATDRDKIPEIVHLMPRILSAAQHESLWLSRGQTKPTPAAKFIESGQYDDEVYNAVYGDDRPDALNDKEMMQKAEEYFHKITGMGHNAVAPQANEPPISCYKRLKARYRQAVDNQRLGVY